MARDKSKKRFSWKLLIYFIIFEFVFTGISGTALVFYGPFNSVKRLVVGTAMSSFKHQYIAKVFLSDKQISDILNPSSQQTVTKNVTQNINDINVANKDDKDIERYDIDGGKYKGYLLIIKDPTRIKVGCTKYLGKQGQRTSEIAEENDAVAAINGGGFTDKSADGKYWVGTGGLPTGSVISDGQLVYKDPNYNESNDTISFTKDGKLIIGKYSLSQLQNMGVTESIAFGPSLIINGKGQVSGDGGQGITARTAIGQTKDGEILLLVLDGRHLNMPGATLMDVENVMAKYGAYNAANLDGGSSTTMFYDGDVINNPCNPLGERTVATSIYVTK